MRNLNLDQLRALSEVIALGSFTAAAQRLSLSQPAVSLQVRELEKRFGLRLVERVGKQAHATAPGRDLVEQARRIFHECDLAEAAMRRFREGWVGRVRIGTGLTALMYAMPSLLKRLRAEHPGIDLVITNVTTRDAVDGIMQNTLDLGVITLPVEEQRLQITPLGEEPLVAIMPAGMRGIPDAVTPDYATRQPLILENAQGAVHGLVMQWLAPRTPLSQAPTIIGTIEAVKVLVASGLGMSIVPASAVAAPSPDMVVRPLLPAMTRTLALVQHRNKPEDLALAIVRNALLELQLDQKSEAPGSAECQLRRHTGRTGARPAHATHRRSHPKHR